MLIRKILAGFRNSFECFHAIDVNKDININLFIQKSINCILICKNKKRKEEWWLKFNLSRTESGQELNTESYQIVQVFLRADENDDGE